MSLVSPLRLPDTRQPSLMTRRGWWLLGLNLLIPGTAQLLAGSRRWGRFAVGATFTLWAIALAGLALFLLWRPVALTIATNVVSLWVAQLGLVFYAVLWLATTINAFTLVRLGTVAPTARGPLAAFTALSLVLAVGTTGWAAWNTGVGRDALGAVFADGSIEDPIDGRYTILLLGGDAGPDRTGLRPDSISLASIDADSGAVTMIGIPRNLYNAPFSEGSPLWGEFPDGYTCGDDCLISYLYPYAEEHPELYPDAEAEGSTPGIEAMRDAVEGVTGIPVQYTALIDMQGFEQLIDALGGVTVDVAEPVTMAINGGTIEGVIPVGEQRLDGYTALWYARSRYNITDFDRMEHQRQIQEAILRQVEPATIITRFQAIAQAGTQVVRTSIPQSMLGVLSDLAVQSRQYPVENLELVPPLVDNVAPDYAAVRAMVAEATARTPVD
ncbi:LCP family protein [Microcella daejeonensis]|uniref:LCP family protein n=1 Tax=Microcella daejeonensis TaxID=2994971 RepID=UPI00226E88A4|nr:LCP family protein [Microcella daejeonensis]WAB84051.1 LCP family protein [Microcella daejeonensis]